MTALNDADAPGLNTSPRPLRQFLWAFALAVILPGVLSGLTLAWWSAQELIDHQEQHARSLAAASAENMGNHLKTMSAGMAVLSLLPLEESHFPDFYRTVKGFAAEAGYNVTLADADGNQFLSTQHPLGAALAQLHAPCRTWGTIRPTWNWWKSS